jgi:hypothetical protein
VLYENPYAGLGGEAVSCFFSLSYANYFVLNRTVLEQMPGAWQEQFVGMLHDMVAAAEAGNVTLPHHFRVHAVTDGGKYTKDPIPHYRHAPRLGLVFPEGCDAEVTG